MIYGGKKTTRKIVDGRTGVPTSIKFGARLRNAVLYAGNEISIVPEVTMIEIPGTDSKDYTLSATYGDGSNVSNLTVTTEAIGFSTTGNKLTATAAANVAKIDVTFSDGFVSKIIQFEPFKDYVLINGEVYTEGTSLGTGSKAIKVCYGSSNAAKESYVVIAHYGGTQKLLDSKVATTRDGRTYVAELSAEVKAGDTIKIFKWEKDDLVPIVVPIELK